MTRLVLALCIAAAGCGADEGPTLSATIVVSGLLADETDSLSLYAFGPKRSDDIMLTCSNLIQQEVAPTDSRLERLGQVDIAVDGASAPEGRLEKISAGAGRIVYVEALDLGNTVLGNGCVDGISVPSGEEVEVEVAVYRLTL